MTSTKEIYYRKLRKMCTFFEEWKVLNSNRSLTANEIQADYLTVNRQPTTDEIGIDKKDILIAEIQAIRQ